MNVPCNEECKHYKEAKENPDSLEPSWKWAYERYDFVVPKAETRWFKCGNGACDENDQENWKKLNPDNPPEFRKCPSCDLQLIQVSSKGVKRSTWSPDDGSSAWSSNEIQNNGPSQRQSRTFSPCPMCGDDEWDYENLAEVICKLCGYISQERSEQYDVDNPSMAVSGKIREAVTDTRKLGRYDYINTNRLINGGDSQRTHEMKSLIRVDIDAWTEIVTESYGRDIANLPPRYCECRKSKQNRNHGRSRAILHLHQILQKKGNFNSISDMLKIAGIHPKHFQSFINFGPVGNHLPNLQLSDGRQHLKQVTERLITSEDSLELDNLLLKEIEKEFDALDDSKQFMLSSNLERGLWTFRNNEPYARENGYILMMIPYAIAITRAIRSIHGPRFRNFIRGLGEKAMADAQFTKGELVPESGWD